MERGTSAVVVGAGLAGLAAARTLVAAGWQVRVFEASDAPGGRMRTDLVDGFRIDRGFQVLNSAYPELKTLGALAHRDDAVFDRGALLHLAGHRHRVVDPRQAAAGRPGRRRRTRRVAAREGRARRVPRRVRLRLDRPHPAPPRRRLPRPAPGLAPRRHRHRPVHPAVPVGRPARVGARDLGPLRRLGVALLRARRGLRPRRRDAASSPPRSRRTSPRGRSPTVPASTPCAPARSTSATRPNGPTPSSSPPTRAPRPPCSGGTPPRCTTSRPCGTPRRYGPPTGEAHRPRQRGRAVVNSVVITNVAPALLPRRPRAGGVVVPRGRHAGRSQPARHLARTVGHRRHGVGDGGGHEMRDALPALPGGSPLRKPVTVAPGPVRRGRLA